MNALPELPAGTEDRINNRIAAALTPRNRIKSLRGVIAMAAGALVIGSGATGIAVAATSTHPTASYCYEHASTSSKAVEVSVTPMRGTPPSSNRFVVAINNCAGTRLAGAFSKGHHEIPGTALPSLIVCERADHAAATFPDSTDGRISSDKFCKALGLRNPIGN